MFELQFNYQNMQFQMRGTPHVHSLVSIKHDGLTPESAESEDIGERSALKNLIKRTISAKLIDRCETDINELPEDCNEHTQRRDEEKQNDWAPHTQYFSDKNDPRRSTFNPVLNYNRTASGLFQDTAVQIQARRLQIANQIHRCCFTCFKYCKDAQNICRFCFPWPENVNSSVNDVTFVMDRDKKERVRLRVIPERNNANINSTFTSPLINCAHGGNSDIQFIMNTHGAAEYAAGYASKAEAPDHRKLQNIFTKAITNLQERTSMVTDCQRLTAAANSVMGSTQVGAVQAMYIILAQDLVISSREVINISPLQSKYYPKLN